ncbi:MAG: 23S rRNA (adenine(1618)-N(6))-methyltransferase RlmF [Undibacterium sp.]|uniref:23S rRNA (adenine(1618)-N(6))-methyltransferase RlmF n=1 Tax=Undibacterium sp. TaxID=1914977 RepID=UPI00271D5695|nr:23S rRNA (adenine(1618)-N(6))-methyltransferase RlmF [Undibacterium sp.]MDO8652664.1 23S rRNA (adenine(1618)-N(6))-methyltransferase RlmF [Undibacterium sp.]
MRTKNIHSAATVTAPGMTTGATPASKLHPRNRHQGRYDFARLLKAEPDLNNFLSINEHGDQGIDFADAAAVKALNRALLKDSYGIQGWDIPPQNLCPPVPGRADYLHYLADLLAGSNRGVIPKKKGLQALDIGTGANLIYPLIGSSEYGWEFVAADINPASLANAQAILDLNPKLAQKINLRLQPSANAIFKGIVGDDEWFDLSMCNPPFHTSLAEAREGTQRKWQNLGKPGSESQSSLNFGGQDAELWCPGGELAFIQRMIKESAQIATRCFWFTTLVSKSASLPGIYAALKQAKVQEQKTIAMSQGQKQSRFVAWTFLTPVQQAAWAKLRW